MKKEFVIFKVLKNVRLTEAEKATLLKNFLELTALKANFLKARQAAQRRPFWRKIFSP